MAECENDKVSDNVTLNVSEFVCDEGGADRVCVRLMCERDTEKVCDVESVSVVEILTDADFWSCDKE